MDFHINDAKDYAQSGILIEYNETGILGTIAGLNERLGIVLISGGTGILKIGDKRISVIAPAVLCINEKEKACLVGCIDWAAQAFYFHPQYINSHLTFDKIRGEKETVSITDRQDICLFNPFIQRDSTYAGLLNLDPVAMKKIGYLFGAIYSELNGNPDWAWSCRARSYFLELLFSLVRIHSSPESRDPGILVNSPDLMNEVILFLNTNYDSRITIKDLCVRFSMNRTTLQEQFRQVTGQSIMAYLISVRVKLSALLLKDTKISIAEIINRMGFSDGAHFNKMFRKHTGYSPLEYRRKFTWLS